MATDVATTAGLLTTTLLAGVEEVEPLLDPPPPHATRQALDNMQTAQFEPLCFFILVIPCPSVHKVLECPFRAVPVSGASEEFLDPTLVTHGQRHT